MEVSSRKIYQVYGNNTWKVESKTSGVVSLTNNHLNHTNQICLKTVFFDNLEIKMISQTYFTSPWRIRSTICSVESQSMSRSNGLVAFSVIQVSNN